MLLGQKFGLAMGATEHRRRVILRVCVLSYRLGRKLCRKELAQLVGIGPIQCSNIDPILSLGFKDCTQGSQLRFGLRLT